MPEYPEGYTSYEDWIDHMSGACPPDDTDWPMPPIPADSEEESDDPGTQ